MSNHNGIPASVARYGDFMFQGRPVHDGDVFSRRHPKMSQLNRAKIFAPFAALAGFDERVRQKEIQYVSKHELDADEAWALNQRLLELHGLTAGSRRARANTVRATVEYFEICDDEENAAYQTKGLYRTITGVVLKVDPLAQAITLQCQQGKRTIRFTDIYRIRTQRSCTLLCSSHASPSDGG